MPIDWERLRVESNTKYEYGKWIIHYLTRKGFDFKFYVIAHSCEQAERTAELKLGGYSTRPKVLSFEKDEAFFETRMGKSKVDMDWIGEGDARLERFDKVFD